MNDIDVIKRVKSGDTEVFSLLVKKYHKNLLSFIYRLINDPDVVEDIGQEVFLRVFKSLKNFNTTRGTPFSAWLFIVARNYCINEIKKRGRMKNISLNDELGQPAENRTNDEILIQKQQQEILTASLEELPEPFKSTILQSFKGKSLNEIANDDGVSPGTVKSRLFRARQKIVLFIHNNFGGQKDERILCFP